MLTYYPLGKGFGKQTKGIEEKGIKQINALTNQSKILEALRIKNTYEETLEKQLKTNLLN